MTKTYSSASDAMRAAYELSQRLGRPVWRHTANDKRGKPYWYVSLDRTPHIALQELVA